MESLLLAVKSLLGWAWDMIPASISILAYLALENLPTLQSWQKRLLLLAVLCTVTFLSVVLFR